MASKIVPNYLLASLTVSLGGLLNGLDTGSIGAITAMSQFSDTIGVLSPFMLGFTVSLIMLTGAVPAAFTGYFADRFGRMKTILLGAVVFALGVVLQAAAGTLTQFLVGRAFAGLGEGIYLSNISVYICEVAPERWRGVLTGLTQLMATTGICIGYFICYGTVRIQSSMAWRLPFLIQAGISVFFILGCFVFPDSPRWLLLHGKRAEALKALERLQDSTVETQRYLLAETTQGPSLSLRQGFTLLFKKAYRARTLLGLFILGAVQLSGIDGVLYYAPVLFSQAGLSSDTASFLSSGVSAILMVAVSIPAFFLADKWGRRTSAISGGLGLAFCMYLIGSLYAADVVHPTGAARWVVIVSVFAFGLIYCATWGLVGRIYTSEIQPDNTRAAANCVAQGLAFFTNWLVAILTPILLDKSAWGAYILFGSIALGSVVVLAVYMPETRGRSLDNIQEAFQRPKIKSPSYYANSLLSLLGLSHKHAERSTNTSSGSLELDSSATPSTFSQSAPVALRLNTTHS